MCGLSLQDSQIEIGSISMFPWMIKSLSTTTHFVPFLNKHFFCSGVIPGVGQNPPKKIQKTPWIFDAGTLFSTSQMVFPLAVCQNLVPLVNIKIAGKWMFIPLKMVLIGIDPYPLGKPWFPHEFSPCPACNDHAPNHRDDDPQACHEGSALRTALTQTLGHVDADAVTHGHGKQESQNQHSHHLMGISLRGKPGKPKS
jgi:hypothetical protein